MAHQYFSYTVAVRPKHDYEGDTGERKVIRCGECGHCYLFTRFYQEDQPGNHCAALYEDVKLPCGHLYERIDIEHNVVRFYSIQDDQLKKELMRHWPGSIITTPSQSVQGADNRRHRLTGIGQAESTSKIVSTSGKDKRDRESGSSTNTGKSFVSNGRYFSSYDDPILPSQSMEDWLQFDGPAGGKVALDNQGVDATGKWLLFLDLEHIDAIWPKLKDSTQFGRLGVSMKATTALNFGNDLICVYTKDWRNVEDIRRVLKELRSLGITARIYYKSDEQTLGAQSGSIYCSPSGTSIELTKKGRDWYQAKQIPLPKL